jgi:hypothetical protein
MPPASARFLAGRKSQRERCPQPNGGFSIASLFGRSSACGRMRMLLAPGFAGRGDLLPLVEFLLSWVALER